MNKPNKMKMKTIKLILSITTILICSTLVFGQAGNKGEKCPLDDEKIQAEKVAFITGKMDLTVKEAQQFWPIYNEFNDKMDVLFKEEHKITRELKKGIEVLSESDIETKLDRLLEIRSEKAKLEQTYHEKYKSVLPVKKVALLYDADREFRKLLLHKYKDHNCTPEK